MFCGFNSKDSCLSLIVESSQKIYLESASPTSVIWCCSGDARDRIWVKFTLPKLVVLSLQPPFLGINFSLHLVKHLMIVIPTC